MADPLNLALAAYKRSGFPNIPTVNCLSERSEATGEGTDSLIARPGLEAFETVGTAPFRALWQRKGLFNDAALVAASQTLYLLDASGATTTVPGTIAGDDLLDLDAGLNADGEAVARFATGSALYQHTEGGAVVAESFPSAGNNVGATSVCFYKGYWLASEAGTDAVYYQNPAETTWNAIQFAAAEYQPDKIVCLRTVGDLVALLGEATTEIWYATGDAASPLEPYGGLKFDFGCRSKDAAVNCLGSLIWVDDLCSVRMFEGSEPRIISDNGLAEQIRRTSAADLRAGFFIFDQHPCYVLTLGTSATWIYDLSTQRWTQATSLALDYWRAHLFCNIGSTVLAADVLSNQIYRLDPDRAKDGDDVFSMRFAALIPPQPQAVPLANIVLRSELGGARQTGDYTDPKVVLELSTNGGKAWGSPKERSLGQTGEYNNPPKWNALGQTRPNLPTIAQFTISDAVRRRVSAVIANSP